MQRLFLLEIEGESNPSRRQSEFCSVCRQRLLKAFAPILGIGAVGGVIMGLIRAKFVV
jgi:hypothetical protein